MLGSNSDVDFFYHMITRRRNILSGWWFASKIHTVPHPSFLYWPFLLNSSLMNTVEGTCFIDCIIYYTQWVPAPMTLKVRLAQNCNRSGVEISRFTSNCYLLPNWPVVLEFGPLAFSRWHASPAHQLICSAMDKLLLRGTVTANTEGYSRKNLFLPTRECPVDFHFQRRKKNTIRIAFRWELLVTC